MAGRPPLPPPTPAEAGQELRRVMAEAAGELGRLDAGSGTRPEVVPPRLGRSHRHSDQVLLDLAWSVLVASESGMEVSPMLTAHGSQVREGALRRLRGAAQDAVTGVRRMAARSLKHCRNRAETISVNGRPQR
jgi:hypothetical protein